MKAAVNMLTLPTLTELSTVQTPVIKRIHRELMTALASDYTACITTMMKRVQEQEQNIKDCVELHRAGSLTTTAFLKTMNSRFAVITACRQFLIQMVTMLISGGGTEKTRTAFLRTESMLEEKMERFFGQVQTSVADETSPLDWYEFTGFSLRSEDTTKHSTP